MTGLARWHMVAPTNWVFCEKKSNGARSLSAFRGYWGAVPWADRVFNPVWHSATDQKNFFTLIHLWSLLWHWGVLNGVLYILSIFLLFWDFLPHDSTCGYSSVSFQMGFSWESRHCSELCEAARLSPDLSGSQLTRSEDKKDGRQHTPGWTEQM